MTRSCGCLRGGPQANLVILGTPFLGPSRHDITYSSFISVTVELRAGKAGALIFHVLAISAATCILLCLKIIQEL